MAGSGVHWRFILVISSLSDAEGDEVGMWALGLVTVCLGVIIDCWTGNGCRLIRAREIVGCWAGSWCRVVLGDEGGLLALE